MREKVFMKEVLCWEWEVKSKETLFGVVEYLTKQYEEEEYFQNDFKDAGWDLMNIPYISLWKCSRISC